MAFEEGDRVVLHDRHSEFDGEVGRVERVSETMFDELNYTVSFEDGQEVGVSEDQLEAADETDAEDEADAEADEDEDEE